MRVLLFHNSLLFLFVFCLVHFGSFVRIIGEAAKGILHLLTQCFFDFGNNAQEFAVNSSSLRRLGCGHGQKSWRYRKSQYRGESFACVAHNCSAKLLAGKAVYVSGRETEMDLTAVSSAIDMVPMAHRHRQVEGVGRVHAWHAAAVHHHARCHVCGECLGFNILYAQSCNFARFFWRWGRKDKPIVHLILSASWHQDTIKKIKPRTCHFWCVKIMLRSFCERIGSYLHDIFNVDAAISPARAVHRVHIREGRLLGLSDRDQGIVSEVARILMQDLHRSAILTKRSVRRRLADDKPATSSYALQSGQSKAELAITSTGVI